jgi:hypothetical protein
MPFLGANKSYFQKHIEGEKISIETQHPILQTNVVALPKIDSSK